MKPVPLFLLAISLPLLLGGCGEEAKVKSVAEVKPKENFTGSQLESELPRFFEDTEWRGTTRVLFLKGSANPYTGKVINYYVNKADNRLYSGKKNIIETYKDGIKDGLKGGWYENGQKSFESNYKDGKLDGLSVRWHENGQKKGEVTFKDDKLVEGSGKWWNSKGEPVDSREEANKE